MSEGKRERDPDDFLLFLRDECVNEQRKIVTELENVYFQFGYMLLEVEEEKWDLKLDRRMFLLEEQNQELKEEMKRLEKIAKKIKNNM